MSKKNRIILFLIILIVFPICWKQYTGWKAGVEQQKAANDEMNGLVNDLNEESYQASKQADKNIKQQQDLVASATDEAYRKYMKGEIEKEEIPLYIANALARSNAPGGAAMQAHLANMDAKGQKITSVVFRM